MVKINRSSQRLGYRNHELHFEQVDDIDDWSAYLNITLKKTDSNRKYSLCLQTYGATKDDVMMQMVRLLREVAHVAATIMREQELTTRRKGRGYLTTVGMDVVGRGWKLSMPQDDDWYVDIRIQSIGKTIDESVSDMRSALEDLSRTAEALMAQVHAAAMINRA